MIPTWTLSDPLSSRHKVLWPCLLSPLLSAATPHDVSPDSTSKLGFLSPSSTPPSVLCLTTWGLILNHRPGDSAFLWNVLGCLLLSGEGPGSLALVDVEGSSEPSTCSLRKVTSSPTLSPGLTELCGQILYPCTLHLILSLLEKHKSISSPPLSSHPVTLHSSSRTTPPGGHSSDLSPPAQELVTYCPTGEWAPWGVGLHFIHLLCPENRLLFAQKRWSVKFCWSLLTTYIPLVPLASFSLIL